MANKKKVNEKIVHKINSTKIPDLRQRTHDGVDKIMDKAESIRDSGQEGIDNLKEKATDIRENVDGYIQKNPEKSVLIAAGIGVIIGAMIAAAMMRKR